MATVYSFFPVEGDYSEPPSKDQIARSLPSEQRLCLRSRFDSAKPCSFKDLGRPCAFCKPQSRTRIPTASAASRETGDSEPQESVKVA